MRRVWLIIVFACFAFTACQKSSYNRLSKWSDPKIRKIKVLSTTQMIDDLVQEIAGHFVLHQALIENDADPHTYELVKGDSDKIFAADLILYNGLDLEHGASLKNCLKKHKRSMSLADEIAKQTAEYPFIVIEGQIDPHIWMDVKLFSKAIDPIVKMLSELDPEHKKVYERRGKKLFAKMVAIDHFIKASLRSIPDDKRFLVTTHDAFYYFSRAYLGDRDAFTSRVASPEGLAPDGQLALGDIRMIINFAKKHKIKTLFGESNLSKAALKKVVLSLQRNQKDVKIAPENLFGDSVGDKSSGVTTYLQMMIHNAKVIKMYLGAVDEK